MTLTYRLEKNDFNVEAIKNLINYYNCNVIVDDKEQDLYLNFDSKYEIYEFSERLDFIKDGLIKIQNMFTI